MADGNNDKKPVIVVKKQAGGEGGAHGGAWKIAYADFMTALMAFFLVMWLINATSEEQRRGIAQFFNPLAQTETLPGAANGMLKAPSPMTEGTSLKKIKNPNVMRPNRHPEQSGQLQHAGHDVGEPSHSITTNRTPIAPAIIPIGGANSGGGRLLPSVGAGQVSALAMKREEQKLAQAMQQLQNALLQNDFLRKLEKTISFQYRRDEVRIELHDTNNVTMFDTASAMPNQQGREMLKEIAAWLAPLPEEISIVGCTDAEPYHENAQRRNTMSNWTLSLVRADNARKFLVQYGYPDRKIRDVTGYGDRNLAEPNNPTASANRRIVIILHKKLPQNLLGAPVSEAQTAPQNVPEDMNP